MKRITLILSVFLILFSLTMFMPAPASAAVRRCNASLGWETTGGNVKGGIIGFTGVGKCGNSVPNRCRTRASAAIERCVRTQYERRWEHNPINSNGSPSPGFDRSPPEACLRAANIENYSLKKDCWTRRINDENSVLTCHNISGSESSVPDYIDPNGVVNVSTAGDVKSALETSVCCFNRQRVPWGVDFPDPEDVHVRLIAQSSSGNDPQRKCNQRIVLSDNYKINCKRVRENICKR